MKKVYVQILSWGYEADPEEKVLEVSDKEYQHLKWVDENFDTFNVYDEGSHKYEQHVNPPPPKPRNPNAVDGIITAVYNKMVEDMLSKPLLISEVLTSEHEQHVKKHIGYISFPIKRDQD